ncbi:hypothetical protein CHUAL_009370 [Chamberlinius hualienensis]
MGGWKIEAFKMFVYMAFPVGTFYLFHQPKYFEEWVVNVKREVFPPDDNNAVKEIQAFAKSVRDKKDEELLKKLEAAAN